MAIFHYGIWAFGNGSDTLVTELSVLNLLKLNSVYYYSSNTVPNHKKTVFIRLFTIKDTSGMNLRTPRPSFWTKAVSIERRNQKNQIMY